MDSDNTPSTDVKISLYAPGLKRSEMPWGAVYYEFHCPGCGYTHVYKTRSGGADQSPCWNFNENPASPSFTPSLLNRQLENNKICHLFLTDGKIHYCGDCTHSLAGQTVELTPFPAASPSA